MEKHEERSEGRKEDEHVVAQLVTSSVCPRFKWSIFITAMHLRTLHCNKFIPLN